MATVDKNEQHDNVTPIHGGGNNLHGGGESLHDGGENLQCRGNHNNGGSYRNKVGFVGRLLSLIVCLLMMCVASLCVNKSLFGQDFSKHRRSAVAGQAALGAEGKGETEAVVTVDGETIINTTGLTNIIGYGGAVPLEIHITDGKIASVEPLPNSETPAFFKRASVICDKWIGKTPQEAVALEVDAVSGATYTSNAIKANFAAGMAAYDKSMTIRDEHSMPLKMWIALAVTLAACIIPLFVKNRIYNNVQLIANVVVLGFWCGQFLDYTQMLRLLSNGFTWPVGVIALAMLVAAFIYPLFGHPQHYCNHICPLGSAQILMAEICHYKIKMSVGTIKALNWFRRILWGFLMLCLWGDMLTEWMDLELFQGFFIEEAPIAIIIVAALFVLLSTIIARPYCRFVCPTGTLFKCAEHAE